MNIYLSQSNMTEEIRFYTKLYANPEFYNLGWLSFIGLSSFNIWNKNNGNYSVKYQTILMNSEGLKLKKFSKYEGKILHSCIN